MANIYPSEHVTRQVAGWCLLDFSVSLVMVSGGLYFSKWFVLDLEGPDWAFNGMFSVCTLLAIVLSPLMGKILDRKQNHLALLRVLLACIGGSVLVIAAASKLPRHSYILLPLTITAFGTALSGSQLFGNVSNSMLRHLSPEPLLQRISGYSVMAGWLGGICGIFLSLPFVSGAIPGLAAGRHQAFLPIAIVFATVAVLAMKLLRDFQAKPSRNESSFAFAWSVKHLSKNKAVLWLLACFMLCMDALITIQNNMPLYMSNVFELSDNEQALTLLGVSLAAAGGGLLSGKLVPPRMAAKALRLALLTWIVLTVGVALSQSAPVFQLLFICAGALFGVTLSVARVAYALLLPPGSDGQYFALYGVFEKFSALTGPLVWSGVIHAAGTGAPAYRTAMVAMCIFFTMSLLAALQGGKTSPHAITS